MILASSKYRLPVVVSVFCILLAGASTALADQVTLSYVDANSNAQSLQLDCNTSTEDLALAASLIGEDGVGIVHAPDAGCGTVAELAAAMASAAPLYAARVAQALSLMSPDDTEAIVAAVNAVSGVNTVAVLAAVNFGPPGTIVGPQSIGSASGLNPEETDPGNAVEPLPPPPPNPSEN